MFLNINFPTFPWTRLFISLTFMSETQMRLIHVTASFLWFWNTSSIRNMWIFLLGIRNDKVALQQYHALGSNVTFDTSFHGCHGDAYLLSLQGNTCFWHEILSSWNTSLTNWCSVTWKTVTAHVREHSCWFCWYNSSLTYTLFKELCHHADTDSDIWWFDNCGAQNMWTNFCNNVATISSFYTFIRWPL